MILGTLGSKMLAAFLSATTIAQAGSVSAEQMKALYEMSPKPALPPAVSVRAAKKEGATAPVSIEGIVLKNAKPIAGALVRLHPAGEEVVVGNARTDASGRFAFPGLSGDSYDLEAFAKGVGAADLRAVHPSEKGRFAASLDLDVRPGMFLVRGRVLGRDGKPAAGARAWATTRTVDWGAPSTPATVHTDDAGNFALQVVDFGNVTVSAVDARSADSGSFEIRNIRGDREVEFQLWPPETTCAGGIVDQEGKAVRDATVELFPAPETVFAISTAISNADGTFRMLCRKSAELTFRARRGSLFGTLTGPVQGDVTVRLGPSAHLRVSFKSHAPIREGIVRWIPKSELGRRFAMTSEPFQRMKSVPVQGGAAELDAIPVGDEIGIYVVIADGRTAEASATLPAARDYEVELNLDATAAIRVKPIGLDGKPAPALACLDAKPRSLADCERTSLPEELLWRQLPPGKHVVHLYPATALPWRQEENAVDREVVLVGGQTADLGEVRLGLAHGTVFGFSLRDRADGVRIENVVPGSEAERAGIAPGQLLQSVDGKPIHTAKEAHEALRGLEGTVVYVDVKGGDVPLHLLLVREPFRF